MDRHGARAVLLADPDLVVIRALGLENTAPGIRPPGVAGLPIPTTILADADHVVRWIDQATDYQVRSDPARVRAALVDALGAPPPAAMTPPLPSTAPRAARPPTPSPGESD